MLTAFHQGPHPFKGEVPHAYSQASRSEELLDKVRQFNEAQDSSGGLRVLRSLFANVVRHPAWAAAKPIYHALNGKDPVSCLPMAKALLSQTYESADEQFVMSQIGALVKKYPFSTSRKLAEEAGMRVFTTGERRNRHMNALLRARRDVHAQHDLHWSMLSIRRYIRRVLGDAPRWDTYPGACNWGPGSNVGVSGRFTHFARKLLADRWTVTPACYPYALTLAKRLPMFWDELGFTRSFLNKETGEPELVVTCVDLDEFEVRFKSRCLFVDHNKISLARKDADKDRTIASEPLLNQMVQMAFEEDLRERLLKEGFNLRDQSRNQDYAREGSLGGFNPRCTIDLRNASGSICRELPYDCLPRGWWIALNSCRSPSWRYKGKTTRYHGFVSMGNGFCFPLETLIFAAICNAAHEYTHSKPDFVVYGDDIIVRQSEALVVLEILRRYGFTANPDKTFITGPFRESCGADWHGGVNVRPVYLDDDLAKLEHRIRAHNAFVRLESKWAPVLASQIAGSLPSFCSHLFRPWADETDEAVDGRYHMMQPSKSLHWDKTVQSPAWYGLTFVPKKDKEIEGHSRFATALYHAALKGADSEMPFAERRETLVRVARFSHSGARSTWAPEAVGPMVRISSSSLFIRIFKTPMKYASSLLPNQQ